MTNPIKAIVVGRHVPNFGETAVEIVSMENVLFSTDADETADQLRELRRKATEAGAVVLLQNTPVVLTAALIKIAAAGETGVQVGAIVSVPGDRKAGVETVFSFGSYPDAMEAAAAVKAANARAQTAVDGTTLTVTVDPVPEFKFSHIEWLL